MPSPLPSEVPARGQPMRAAPLAAVILEAIRSIRVGPGLRLTRVGTDVAITLAEPPGFAVNRSYRIIPTATEAGKGNYTAKLAGGPPAAINPATDLTVAILTGGPVGPDVLLCCSTDIGTDGGHDLVIGTPYLAHRLAGKSTDGRDCYQTDGFKLDCEGT